jgi:hypothetical protein
MAAPNTRRSILFSTMNMTIEQRVEEQMEIVLKVGSQYISCSCLTLSYLQRFEHEKREDSDEVSKFLREIQALDFPMLKFVATDLGILCSLVTYFL